MPCSAFKSSGVPRITNIENEIKEFVDAKRLELRAIRKLIRQENKPAKVKTYTFISPAVKPETDAKGNLLTIQAATLVQLFIGELPPGQSQSYTAEEVADMLTAYYPCVGDKMASFVWHYSKVLKPMGLVK